jgi:putative chitinase
VTAITDANLRALVPSISPGRAIIYADALDESLPLADLSTNRRVRHFMAQITHESGGLRSLVESTAYRDPVRLDRLFRNVQGVEHARRLIAAGPQAIANTIYAFKLGNGGPASGDGFRYRGRGFMMITGRSNYRKMGEATGMPLEQQPELLEEPQAAAKAAVLFWKSRRINLAADRDDLDAVTELVNGPAKLHLAERRDILTAAKRIWPG